jgi:formamidopyrimidine-DNA glycosylase
MPELPEVQTTVNGLNETVKDLIIKDVWTSYESLYYKNKESIKCPKYFEKFKKAVLGSKITGAERRAKNILIHIQKVDKTRDLEKVKKVRNLEKAEKTILIHMKMTGHLMYGQYENTFVKMNKGINQSNQNRMDPWKPVSGESDALKDPFNRHIRLVFTLSNHKNLVLSDMRKFAKIIIADTESLYKNPHLSHLGPEPLESSTTYEVFIKQLSKKSKGNIKTVLMDQTILSGIGNIYSDEALWLAKIHPKSKPKDIPLDKMKDLYKKVKEVLSRGIDFGGDSMSDYRNIYGKKGDFQNHHNAYRKTGQKCSMKGCDGNIKREVINGRSGHFCDKHQILY